MDRLTRAEAAEFIGCSISQLYRMERTGLLDGTYYVIGKRKLYITDELEKWMRDGGELGAAERKYFKSKRRLSEYSSEEVRR